MKKTLKIVGIGIVLLLLIATIPTVSATVLGVCAGCDRKDCEDCKQWEDKGGWDWIPGWLKELWRLLFADDEYVIL